MPATASVDQELFLTDVSWMWEKVLTESCSAQVAESTKGILISLKNLPVSIFPKYLL